MMKNLHFLILIILLLTGINSCASNQASGTANNAKSSSNTVNAKDSINWEGKYTGRIPAASSPGINVQLTLRADNTFSIVYDYIDRHGFVTGMGSFTWNEAGDVINLKHKDFPPYYRVGRDYLLQLDLEGKVITGDLAEFYILRKVEN
jgi:uncharacterized lipoprotein NlpE involved in copper resistance